VRDEDTIEIRAVTVMRETDLALLCRIGSQHRWIRSAQLLSGSTIARVGDVGTIFLGQPFAVEQGLVPFQGSHDPRCCDRRGHRAQKPGEGAAGGAGGCPAEAPGRGPEYALHRLAPEDPRP